MSYMNNKSSHLDMLHFLLLVLLTLSLYASD